MSEIDEYDWGVTPERMCEAVKSFSVDVTIVLTPEQRATLDRLRFFKKSPDAMRGLTL